MKDDVLARRILQEAGARSCLLDAATETMMRQAGTAIPKVDPVAKLAFLKCRQVSMAGEALTAAAAAASLASDVEVIGVLTDEAWPGLLTDKLAQEADGELRVVAITRLLTPTTVFEMTPEGLAIIELKQGVSAADVQLGAVPTLKISPQLKQLLAKPTTTNNDGG